MGATVQITVMPRGDDRAATIEASLRQIPQATVLPHMESGRRCVYALVRTIGVISLVGVAERVGSLQGVEFIRIHLANDQ